MSKRTIVTFYGVTQVARPKGSNSDAKERLAAAAGRSFRSGGYGGVGVDGLAKQAGLTSGAFYAHYGSKAEAFRRSVRDGVHDLAEGILRFHEGGGDWVAGFIDFYLTERVSCDIGESCALQSLSVDVARAGDDVRSDYGAELNLAIDALALGVGGRDRAIALLALLSGGVSMARAVNSPKLADEIVASLRVAAAAIVDG